MSLRAGLHRGSAYISQPTQTIERPFRSCMGRPFGPLVRACNCSDFAPRDGLDRPTHIPLDRFAEWRRRERSVVVIEANGIGRVVGGGQRQNRALLLVGLQRVLRPKSCVRQACASGFAGAGIGHRRAVGRCRERTGSSADPAAAQPGQRQWRTRTLATDQRSQSSRRCRWVIVPDRCRPSLPYQSRPEFIEQ